MAGHAQEEQELGVATLNVQVLAPHMAAALRSAAEVKASVLCIQEARVSQASRSSVRAFAEQCGWPHTFFGGEVGGEAMVTLSKVPVPSPFSVFPACRFGRSRQAGCTKWYAYLSQAACEALWMCVCSAVCRRHFTPSVAARLPADAIGPWSYALAVRPSCGTARTSPSAFLCLSRWVHGRAVCVM